jgi:hypothetical protein
LFLLIVCGFLVVTVARVALRCFGYFNGAKLQASIQLLGYTNAWQAQAIERQSGLDRPWSSAITMYAPDGARVAILQVSNSSPYSIIRRRGPEIIIDPRKTPSDYVPAGWNVLRPQECEQFWLAPPTNRARWRFAIVCEKLGRDSYGVRPPNLTTRLRRWLRDHSLPVPEPGQPPAVQIYSDWIER